MLCSVEGCDRERYGHGFCTMHYQRYKRHGDPLKVKGPLVHKGKTIVEWAIHQNIPENTIRARLKLGWSIDAAILTPVFKPEVIEGKTIAQWSEENDVPPRVIRQRLKTLRWSTNEALRLVVDPDAFLVKLPWDDQT